MCGTEGWLDHSFPLERGAAPLIIILTRAGLSQQGWAAFLEREFLFNKRNNAMHTNEKGWWGSLLRPDIYYCSTCLEIGTFIWLTNIKRAVRAIFPFLPQNPWA